MPALPRFRKPINLGRNIGQNDRPRGSKSLAREVYDTCNVSTPEGRIFWVSAITVTALTEYFIGPTIERWREERAAADKQRSWIQKGSENEG